MTAAAWPAGALRSPSTGRILQQRGDRLLVADGEAWPVIDGIPFLRSNRVELAAEAVRLIEAGETERATALLLRDQDPYAPDPPPSVEACEQVVRGRDALGFRSAMQALGFGRVGDYFAHRWTDPTFLSGLALLGLALPAERGCAFELACGAGHFLSALHRAEVAASGGDLVFAKLWLARHFVSPEALLVCFDAEAPWPFAAGITDTVFCHDAFYFLPDKPGIASQMKRLAGERGTVAVGHAHNADAANHSAGAPLTVAGYASLFPGAQLFDDADLTEAFASGRAPVAADASALAAVAALSLLWRAGGWTGDSGGRTGFGTESGPTLQLNPLYRQGVAGAGIAWPSLRYEQEYAALATYPMRWSGPAVIDRADNADAEALLRRRIYVELPDRW